MDLRLSKVLSSNHSISGKLLNVVILEKADLNGTQMRKVRADLNTLCSGIFRYNPFAGCNITFLNVLHVQAANEKSINGWENLLSFPLH